MNDMMRPVRLVPRRLPNGLLAWQATLGYISAQHSPDSLLEVHVYPTREEETRWSANVSWGKKQEAVQDQLTLGEALNQLWQKVERNHYIFISEEDTVRRPSGYEPDEWIDGHTLDMLTRMIETTEVAFPQDWRIIMTYQPVDMPEMRVQMRLLAKGNSITIGGRGPALLDAARELYRNAAPIYALQAQPDDTTQDEAGSE